MLLFEGLDSAETDATLGVTGAPPLSRMLKFLLSKNGSDIGLIGGSWSKSLDGGDPAICDSAPVVPSRPF